MFSKLFKCCKNNSNSTTTNVNAKNPNPGPSTRSPAKSPRAKQSSIKKVPPKPAERLNQTLVDEQNSCCGCCNCSCFGTGRHRGRRVTFADDDDESDDGLFGIGKADGPTYISFEQPEPP